MAIEKSTGVFQFKLDKLVSVYENSDDLIAMLKKYDLYIPDGTDPTDTIPEPLRITQYEEILTVFEEDSVVISDNTIDYLLYSEPLIRSAIDTIMYQSLTPIVDEMYRQLLYTYKYGTVKHFFLMNAHDFMPDYDVQVMHDQDKMRLWQQAFMRQFDRFADIIDSIIEIQDIDVIGEEYLAYIAQLVGFERGDTSLGDALFREITKNIIEVYRIKGTNYSFELFFNFIGFEIDVIEYWFDKRFYLSSLSVNPYTKETSKFKFAYYLTPIKPTDGYPQGMNPPFVLKEDSITTVKNGLTFDQDLLDPGTDEQLRYYLGIDEERDANDEDYYSYFKTNVIEYSISKLSSTEILEGISPEDEATIQAYTNFLTPIFVSKKVIINVTPFEDDARGILDLMDTDYFIDSVLQSMFFINRYGELNGAFEDEFVWDQDNMDWLTEYINLSLQDEDMNELQSPPGLYDGSVEPINGYEEIYPYIDNKPDTTTDWVRVSTNDPLDYVPVFMNDVFTAQLRSNKYHGYGTGITFGQTVTQAHMIPISNGVIYVSGTADTAIGAKYTGDGEVVASGSPEYNPAFSVTGSGTVTMGGLAHTAYGFEYFPSGFATVSGSPDYNPAFSVVGLGGVLTDGTVVTETEMIVEGTGGAITSGIALTSGPP